MINILVKIIIQTCIRYKIAIKGPVRIQEKLKMNFQYNEAWFYENKWTETTKTIHIIRENIWKKRNYKIKRSLRNFNNISKTLKNRLIYRNNFLIAWILVISGLKKCKTEENLELSPIQVQFILLLYLRTHNRNLH